MLPTDAQERKDIPIYSGFVCYFPDAIVEVTKVSKRGNDQHNPGEKLHWNRSKSGDELDALARHLVGSTYPQPLETQIEEAAARTWRSLADLQKLCEKRDTSLNARAKMWAEYENSKSQKIAPPYATRKDCTGDPACLTDGGRQAKWRDELVEESRRQVAAIRKQHEASAESIEGYIESLQECGEGDCE